MNTVNSIVCFVFLIPDHSPEPVLVDVNNQPPPVQPSLAITGWMSVSDYM